MNQAQNKQDAPIAKEIFRQLSASSVGGFPFFNYTGAKAKIWYESEPDALYLRFPRGSKFSRVSIKLEASDTYTVKFYLDEELVTIDDWTHSDIYADALVELIVKEQGIN